MIAVEQFIHKKFPPQKKSGPLALGYSPSQGRAEIAASTRMTHATRFTAASSSAARAPTPTPAQDYGPSERATLSTPTSAVIFSTVQSDVRAGAIRAKSVILINGHLET